MVGYTSLKFKRAVWTTDIIWRPGVEPWEENETSPRRVHSMRREEDQCLYFEEYQHIRDKEQRIAQKDDCNGSGNVRKRMRQEWCYMPK